MKKEDYERELGKLFIAAQKNGDIQLALDILNQLQHYGFDLPPLEVPRDFSKEQSRKLENISTRG